MLNAQFFANVQRVLKVGGTVTVLTDNEWYGHLLATQLNNFVDAPQSLLESVDLRCSAGDDSTSGDGVVGGVIGGGLDGARSRKVCTIAVCLCVHVCEGFVRSQPRPSCWTCTHTHIPVGCRYSWEGGAVRGRAWA